MKTYLKVLCVSSALIFWANPVTSAEFSIPDELDAFRAEICRTVQEGDFAAYRQTYHPDAVVVSGISNSSQPASQSLVDWEDGFIQTRAGKQEPKLEFRFTQRINNPTTAHETGIFSYTSTGEDGQPKATYIHFEALLIKKDGWKTLMEYQKALATPEEWESAARPVPVQ